MSLLGGEDDGQSQVYASALERLADETPQLVHKIYMDWLRKENNIAKLFPEQRAVDKICPFVPRTFPEYAQHNVEMVEAAEKAGEKWRRQQELWEQAKADLPSYANLLPFRGKQFGEQNVDESTDVFMNICYNFPLRGSVLAQPTIFQKHAPGWLRLIGHSVSWPDEHEASWEGDQRVASENGRFNRFPPLPRRDDYEDANFRIWSDKEYVKPYPMDDVWPVPSLEESSVPAKAIWTMDIPKLLNLDLLKELNDPPIPVPPRKALFHLASQRLALRGQ